jgi:tRNA A37 threonylcarbamoyladenosine synthetase subunit TsaC/SUA5/YrdC
LVVSSVHNDDEITLFPTDPELIYEAYKHTVDVVIDGGMGTLTPSTVIDVTGAEPEVVRLGQGPLDVL